MAWETGSVDGEHLPRCGYCDLSRSPLRLHVMGLDVGGYVGPTEADFSSNLDATQGSACPKLPDQPG